MPSDRRSNFRLSAPATIQKLRSRGTILLKRSSFNDLRSPDSDSRLRPKMQRIRSLTPQQPKKYLEQFNSKVGNQSELGFPFGTVRVDAGIEDSGNLASLRAFLSSKMLIVLENAESVRKNPGSGCCAITRYVVSTSTASGPILVDDILGQLYFHPLFSTRRLLLRIDARRSGQPGHPWRIGRDGNSDLLTSGYNLSCTSSSCPGSFAGSK